MLSRHADTQRGVDRGSHHGRGSVSQNAQGTGTARTEQNSAGAPAALARPGIEVRLPLGHSDNLTVGSRTPVPAQHASRIIPKTNR
jgi:hypothetical protein